MHREDPFFLLDEGLDPGNFDLQDECLCFLDPFHKPSCPSVRHHYLWLWKVTERPFRDFCCVTVPSQYVYSVYAYGPLPRFPGEATIVVFSSFSVFLSYIRSSRRGKQATFMGPSHHCPSFVTPLFSSKGSAPGDRDIPQTLGLFHKSEMLCVCKVKHLFAKKTQYMFT